MKRTKFIYLIFSLILIFSATLITGCDFFNSVKNFVSPTETPVSEQKTVFNLTGVNDGGFTADSVSATLESKLSEYLTVKYSCNTNGTFPTEATSEYKLGTKLSDAGNYLIVISDPAGNTISRTFTIDKTAPTLTLDGVKDGGFTNVDVTATWGTETGSVTAQRSNDKDVLTVKYAYTTNDVFPTMATTPYTAGTKLSEDGNYLMTITDFAGNATSYTFTIDTSAPMIVLSGVSNYGFTNTDVTATWGTTVSKKAVELSVKYSFNTNGTFPTTADTECESGITFTDAGNYLMEIADVAGNSMSYTFTIDKTAPTLTIAGTSNGGFTKNNVSATWGTGKGAMTSQLVNDDDVLSVKYSCNTEGAFPTTATKEYKSGTALSDSGNYLMTITDKAGNTTSYTFTIDKSAPTLALSGVANGGFTKNNVSASWGTGTGSATAQRMNSDDALTVKYSYSTNASFPTIAITQYASGTSLSTVGNYYMTITDKAGNTTSYTFTIDKSAPTLTLSGASDGGFTKNNVSASWTTGTGSMTSQRVNNNDALTVKYTCSTNASFPTSASTAYTANTALTDGGNYLMSITDKAGNTTSYTFTIDKSAPTLALSGVASGGFTKNNVSASWGTDTGTATSQRINTSDTLTVKYSYNTTSSFPTTASTAYTSGATLSSAGNYYMTITDRSGNTTTYTFTIDKTAPTFALTGVVSGGFTKGNVSASWGTSYNNGVSDQRANANDALTVKYASSTNASFPTSATSDYTSGSTLSNAGNYFLIITDKAGNSTSCTFTIDKSAPSVTLTGVANNGFTNGNVSASWTTSTGSMTSQRVNNNDTLTVKYASKTDGTFPTSATSDYTAGTQFTSVGNYLITITDKAGNVGTFKFTIDRSAPTLTLSGVTNNGFTKNNPSASWTTGTGSMTSQRSNTNDVLTVKYTYSTNATFPTTASTEYASGTALTNAGNYYMTITDAAGNVSAYKFTVDKTAPSLNLTGTTNNGFTQNNVKASWATSTGSMSSQRVNNNDILTVKYSCNTNGTFPTTASTAYTSNTELTAVGSYYMTITDSAGNVSTYKFTIDRSAPTLTLSGVTNGGFTNGSPSASWTTGTGSTTSQCANANDALTVKYSYNTNATFPTSALNAYTSGTALTNAGNYYVTITDKAGNSTSYTFTVDKTAPTITLTGASNNGFTNGKVSATWGTDTGSMTTQRVNNSDTLTVKYSYNTDGTFPTTAGTAYTSNTELTAVGNYYMTITDRSGNVGSYRFTIDKSAPTLSLSGVTNGGFTNGNPSASWTTGTGSMTSQRSNTNDVLTVKYTYSTNATFPTSASTAYTSGTALTNAGNYYMTITDKAGNSTSYTFTVDKTAPTITLSGAANNGFTNGKVSATWGTGTGSMTSQLVNGSDTLTVKYASKTDGTFPTSATTAYTSGTQLSVVGNYLITITDKAGNVGTYRFTIDKSAPTLTLVGVYNGGFSNTEVSATWGMDITSMTSQRVNSSDVLTVKYSRNTNGTYPTSATTSYTDSTALTATGYYLMTITDKAGNTTSYTFNVDMSVPSYIPASGTKFIMTWSDEFNGTSLDTSKWYYELNRGYDTQAGWAWGTQEEETYTNSNTTVSGGTLKITAKKSGSGYTSARINTRGSSITNNNVYDTNSNFSQTYGRFEAMIKLPAGQGLWPAFWLMPVSNNYGKTKTMWPFNGEIDIMEAKGRLPNQTSSAVHYSTASSGHTYSSGWYGTSQLGSDFTITNWHLYAVEWCADRLDFYVDNIKTLTVERSKWHNSYYNDYSTSSPFDQPFYIILNLAVGGQFDNGVTPDSNFTQATMEVDYVRVYQYYDILNHPQ